MAKNKSKFKLFAAGKEIKFKPEPVKPLRPRFTLLASFIRYALVEQARMAHVNAQIAEFKLRQATPKPTNEQLVKVWEEIAEKVGSVEPQNNHGRFA